MSDPIKKLMDADELSCWFGEYMACDVIEKLEKAGIAIEDVPDWLEDYARWMRANLEMFR